MLSFATFYKISSIFLYSGRCCHKRRFQKNVIESKPNCNLKLLITTLLVDFGKSNITILSNWSKSRTI